MDLLQINPQKEEERIIAFLKNTLRKTSFSQYVIALSGGIDSGVAATLAVKAIGKENVHALFLPFGSQSPEGLDRAYKLCNTLSVPSKNIMKIDIQKTVENIVKSLRDNPDKIRLGNIMARVRMIYLYDQAKNKKALVCGTENKSEYLLGYFTRFGDEASDIEPLQHLYKTQVRKLAEYLQILAEIRKAPPTAGLWAGQTDEGEFGFTYEQADKILTLKLDQRLNEEEIIKNGNEKEIVQKVLKRAKQNAFKHILPYKLPPTPY